MTPNKEDSLLSNYKETIANLKEQIKINVDYFTVKSLINY